MSWIKFLLGCLTVGFCILLGYFAASRYRERRDYFSQFAVFHERYLTELCYTRKPLSGFLAQYVYTGEFGKTIAAFAENRGAIFRQPFLTKEEQIFCTDYFTALGRGDVRSQNEYFSAQSTVINAKKEESGREAKQRGELYLKLGLLAGLAIVILIV